MKRRQLLAGVLAMIGLGGCGSSHDSLSIGQSSSQLPIQPLESALEAAFKQVTASGVIAGVQQGSSTWVALRGQVSPSDPTTPVLETHSRIGSVTKTVTATAILQLVDEGLLALDEPIGRWFPGMADGQEITIRMLGNMSSGVASFTEDPDSVLPYFANPYRNWDVNALIESSLAKPRLFAPGTQYHYSNTNYLMLGSILEQVLRMPIGQAMQIKIFQPLGMAQTSYPLSAELPPPSWRGSTLQSSNDGQPIDSSNWSPTLFGASGQLISTLKDMLTWAKEAGTGSLLSAATQAQRLKPNPHSSFQGDSYLFGLAIQKGWLTHAGASPGFIADIAYLPGSDVRIAVLANSDVLLANGQGSADFVSRSLRSVFN